MNTNLKYQVAGAVVLVTTSVGLAGYSYLLGRYAGRKETLTNLKTVLREIRNELDKDK